MQLSDYDWVKVRSWHAVATPTRLSNTYRTVCNKTVKGTEADGTFRHDLPARDKSCESCFRKLTKLSQEQAEIDAATESSVGAGVGAIPVDAAAQPTPITAGQGFQPTLTTTTEPAAEVNEA